MGGPGSGRMKGSLNKHPHLTHAQRQIRGQTLGMFKKQIRHKYGREKGNEMLRGKLRSMGLY